MRLGPSFAGHGASWRMAAKDASWMGLGGIIAAMASWASGCGADLPAPADELIPEQAACRSETHAVFCSRLGKECGPLSANDNCGEPRSVVSCGSCAAPDACDAAGKCSCAPETDAEFCRRLGKQCGPLSGMDSCSSPRVVDCGACVSGAPVPGRIEAEDFVEGGEGVAYHDTTAGNFLAAYRDTDVDIGACSEGGYRIGYIFPGEWLRYALHAATAGTYTLAIRYATDAAAQMHIEVDGTPVGSAIALASTGSWYTWATITRVLSLSAGPHVFKVVDDAGNMDFNYFAFTAGGAAEPCGNGTCLGGETCSSCLQDCGPCPPASGTQPEGSVSVKDFGAKGDGMTDDTAAFRAAAAAGKVLWVPKPPAHYKITAYVPLKSSIYGDGSMPEIRMYGADGDPDQGVTHSILYISAYHGSGLVIEGLHLNGQWNGGTNGEYSHCINIRESSNITIQNNFIERAYGDNIFIGSFNPAVMPSNIVVQNNKLVGPHRCTVVLDGATNVTIRGNYHEKRTNYVGVIDLEADPLGYQYVRDVVIDSNVFNAVAQFGNAGAVSLNNPNGNPLSGNITISNNTGQWADCASYLDTVTGGSGHLVTIIQNQWSSAANWYNVTAPNNVKGSTNWSLP